MSAAAAAAATGGGRVLSGTLRLVTGDRIDLSLTFLNGQAWGWQQLPHSATWRGVVGSHIVSLRPAAAADGGLAREVLWEAHSAAAADASAAAAAASDADADAGAAAATALGAELGALLHADVSMSALYAAWSAADARLARTAAALPGMRVLRQAPWECLASFICSSNNNVGRIGGMLARLRAAYGAPLGELDGVRYHAFPSPAALAAAPDDALRALGMGYRAPFLRGSAARVLAAGGEAWLRALRAAPGDAARAALMALPGVGPKVADCVALFSLDATATVPVDTHVWDIACCFYARELAGAPSLTPAVYARVGALFRARFGAHAGWAHSLLFAAELPALRARLPAELTAEMEAYRVEEAARKAGKRAAAAARKAARGAAAAPAGEKEEEEGEEERGGGVAAEDAGAGAGGGAEAAAVATQPAASKGKRRRRSQLPAAAAAAAAASAPAAAAAASAVAAEALADASGGAASAGAKRARRGRLA